AEASLTKAALLSPGDPRTARNLASVYAARCDYAKAQAILEKALQTSPNDSLLTAALSSVKLNSAGQAADAKNFDAAIATYTEETKRNPTNADNWISLASTQFNKAQSLKDDDAARPAAFRQAGDAYAKACELKPTEADLAFNAALSYQNAKETDKSATYWEKAVKLKPDD